MEPISATYIRSVSSNSPKTWPRFDFRVSMSCQKKKNVRKSNKYHFNILSRASIYSVIWNSLTLWFWMWCCDELSLSGLDIVSPFNEIPESIGPSIDCGREFDPSTCQLEQNKQNGNGFKHLNKIWRVKFIHLNWMHGPIVPNGFHFISHRFAFCVSVRLLSVVRQSMAKFNQVNRSHLSVLGLRLGLGVSMQCVNCKVTLNHIHTLVLFIFFVVFVSVVRCPRVFQWRKWINWHFHWNYEPIFFLIEHDIYLCKIGVWRSIWINPFQFQASRYRWIYCYWTSWVN